MSEDTSPNQYLDTWRNMNRFKMNSEGYPEQNELDLIEKWDYNDFLGLIDYIQERWAYADCGYFAREWAKDGITNSHTLILKLSTAGWSGNEDIINTLLKNKMFCMIWYYSWRRGGHYQFRINPYNCGYITVSKYCKDKNVSRQYIYKNTMKFDWIHVAEKTKLIRPKKIFLE